MQFRHPESYRILSDGRILQDPMGSGVGYVNLGMCLDQWVFIRTNASIINWIIIIL